MKEILDLSSNVNWDFPKSISTLDKRVAQSLFSFNEKRETARKMIAEFETVTPFSSPSEEDGPCTRTFGSTLFKILTDILKTGDFHTEYQPILSLETGKVFAYEALARFYVEGKSISPEFVFNELHQEVDLFFEFEKNLKRFQIRNRPQGKRLFLNLDPHVCKNRSQSIDWHEFLSKERDIVCEIIENTDSTLIEDTRFCLDALKQLNIPIALDDVGGKRNLFCFDFLEYSKFIKFDKCWLDLFRTKAYYKNIVWGFLDFAREADILCVLEGIETQEDLLIAAEMGFPLVQGFLFQSKNLVV
ncbi:cyclic diguanylate phosphodiesterase (EAL) domain protein [Leptospira borgpetersenii serovar Pomona str. 200901868]|uniref:Cyclic diguanylate phosphodiesterase (EAL) domain protein n=1 Tax=Leptospira borgpetersenii serovar Pomona str. 200901868 TaxID=1192866 RepID=M6W018_LEPBO|nr:EAL domain-containing protein [Leptospira borgpetersenii]EMO62430.1 cyclic diguanylate phosphodiesterase (EAL) domain protein [Leptospira borgpetersenii serovar Pomona str. 200901868]MBF3377791.1 EAL domain-containing protein [Leptospira borgpetersenii serovar Balcanica]